MQHRGDRPDVVYGRKPVDEALHGRRTVLRTWTAPGVSLDLGQPGKPPPPLTVVSRQQLAEICGSTDNQGVVAEVEPYPYADADALLDDELALVVVLDQVQDPQNLGAICRTAECAGVAGVVIPERRAAGVTAAVCKASAGAVEHLPVARVRNVADYLHGARERDAWIYGADAAADQQYTAPDYRGRTVLVIGAEGSGLRPRVRAACDQLVAIPMHGRIGSLNVSAAAAVLIYEAHRRRGERP